MSSEKNAKRRNTFVKILLPICLFSLLVAGIGWGRHERTTEVEIVPDPIPGSETGSGSITKMVVDSTVIPDRFNCGCSENLQKIVPGETLNHVIFRDGGDSVVLEFAYKNKTVSGTVVFKDIDFSDYTLAMYNEGLVDRDIFVRFVNCKFACVKNSAAASRVKYQFDNCSFSRFYGSDAEFNRCLFGHTYKDGMVPFQNITVNDCYFCDLSSTDPASVGLHSDGTQIYGAKNVPVSNVAFNRCRFEVPAIQTSGNTASVNACIMFQLEYNDAVNVSFNNCYVNGGGYSIYAYAFDGLSVNNVSFNNISIGGAHLFGDMHPNTNPNIVFNNLHDTEELLVSSVWKANGKTHVIVSNDTTVERTLNIVTNTGEHEFIVPACLGGRDLRYNYLDIPFSKFPFDIDYVLDEDADYVVCYDTTTDVKQVRFVSFDGKAVMISTPPKAKESTKVATPSSPAVAPAVEKTLSGSAGEKDSSATKQFDSLSGDSNSEGTSVILQNDVAVNSEILASGECGKNVSYSLNGAGLLSIKGSGAIDSYNSTKTAPWFVYADKITAVEIGDGITQIGNQAFRKLTKVTSVDFPSSVISIGTNALSGCTKLEKVSFYPGLQSIGKNAFGSTKVSTVTFYGTQEEWSNVVIDSNNERLGTANVVFSAPAEGKATIILDGSCGSEVCFELLSDGTLRIFGRGDMTNFNSTKTSPWYDYIDDVASVVIEEGVTSIGSQSFRNAKELASVELPNSLVSIGTNSFINCKSLKKVSIGINVTSIGRYAFSGSGLIDVTYAGSPAQWEKITIGDKNAELTSHYKR